MAVKLAIQVSVRPYGWLINLWKSCQIGRNFRIILNFYTFRIIFVHTEPIPIILVAHRVYFSGTSQL